MLLPLVSPEGSLATEASGRGGAVQGRPVLVKDILQWQYLVHLELGAVAARRPCPIVIVRPQTMDREPLERLRAAAPVGGAAVAGGGADGAGPLQGEREVVELALRLAAQRRARGDGAQAGGHQRPDHQHAHRRPRRRHRHLFLLLSRSRPLGAAVGRAAAQYPTLRGDEARWDDINCGCLGPAVSLASGPAPTSQGPSNIPE